MVCAVQSVDACTFLWKIALACPSWEPNSLQGLDIGTGPRFSDVVHAGHVLSAWQPDCSNSSATIRGSSQCALSEDEQATRFFITLASGKLSLEMPEIGIGDPDVLLAWIGEESSFHFPG